LLLLLLLWDTHKLHLGGQPAGCGYTGTPAVDWWLGIGLTLVGTCRLQPLVGCF